MSTYTGVTHFKKQSGFLAHPVQATDVDFSRDLMHQNYQNHLFFDRVI